MTAIVRSRRDRVVAGVLGGLAEHFGWPPTRTRVGYVVLSVLSAAFPGMLVYAVLWFVLPEEDSGPRDFRVGGPD